MGTWLDMVGNLQAIDFKGVSQSLNEKHSKEIVSGVKNQLWDGQNPDGSDITPSYLDDPYFKTRKQAMRYANWKMKISRNSKRNKYAPNLFINGYFYSTISVAPSPQLQIVSTWKEVENKYKDALGLSVEHGNQIIEDFIRPDFESIVEGATGLKFG